MSRVELYRFRERRAFLAALLIALLLIACAVGVIGFAVLRLPWLAIGCGASIPLLWVAYLDALRRCSYWSARRYEEAYHMRRESGL